MIVLKGHDPELVSGAWFRVLCSCGYRSKRWEYQAEAWDAFHDHLAQVRRERRKAARTHHRTAVSPWRFV